MTSYRIDTEIPYQRTEDELYRLFDLWRAKDPDVTCAGHPRRFDSARNLVGGKDQPWTKDTVRVTISFVHQNGQRITVSEDRHPRPADNLRVLYLCLDGMRKNERRGFGEIMASAYLQLQAPVERDPWLVLGVTRQAPRNIIDAAYKAAAKRRHPDAPGGSHEAMAELNAAYDAIKAELEAAGA